MRKTTIIIILLLVMSTMLACSVTFQNGFDIIETITEDIQIEHPNTDLTPQLTLEFGAGRVFLQAGTDYLLEGTASYNIEQLDPEVEIKSNRIRVYQGEMEYMFGGWPNLDELENTWDFYLGDQPLDLVINAGAFSGKFDLGGISLETLKISDGASDVDLEFSELNKVVLQEFDYSTGASSVSLEKLANANMEEMNFECGAGSYTLDFSGELQRDLDVSIEASAATITIIVPEGVDAVLDVDGAAYQIYANDNWDAEGGGEYSLDNDGPTITFRVELSAGSLVLEN